MIARRAVLCLALALLVTPVTGVERDFAAMQIERYDPPRPAPAFELPDLNGRTVRLGDLLGKVVLLYFWATW